MAALQRVIAARAVVVIVASLVPQKVIAGSADDMVIKPGAKGVKLVNTVKAGAILLHLPDSRIDK